MSQSATIAYNNEEYIHSTVVFGEVKKGVFSKDLKGGEVNNVFGATEVDFTEANLSGFVVLNIWQVCGELKLIVPQNWRVETDLSLILATVDDKRQDLSQTRNTDKVLVVTGTCALATVTILHSVPLS